MLVTPKKRIRLILTESSSDDFAEEIKKKFEAVGISFSRTRDPMRTEPAILTPRGIFTGKGGIEYYLRHFTKQAQ